MSGYQNSSRNREFGFDPKIPPSLLDLEKWAAEMIVKPLKETGPLNLPIYEIEVTAEIEKRISPGAHLSPAQCIGIYNQQYWFRFFTLAQENYPTLVRLFGYADFNRLIVEPAILKYPANHWGVFFATAQIPRWIEEEYQGEDKTFIFQIAQLDALYHNCFYAPALPSNSSSTTFINGLYRHNLLDRDLEPNRMVEKIDSSDCFSIKLDGDLLKFKNQLLEESVEYWTEHPFPEIDFSKAHFISFCPTTIDFIYKESYPKRLSTN